jgi:CDP-6-deoxy-D-xylo-4-hexulose-3-dehydrase
MALKSEFIPEDRRLQDGDEIITTALSFPTTVSPIIMAGCVPVFVDVESGTWNASPQQVREMISHKTKAMIFSHGLGNPFNVDMIRYLCREHNITLIEDNCDSLGSEWNGGRTGSFGDVSTLSFYPAHHISTGEGGAVCTNNAMIKRALTSIINWGRDCWCRPNCDDTCNKRFEQQLGGLPYGYDHKNTYSNLGMNLKMTDVQAAIGVEQMKRLPGYVVARRFNHEYARSVFKPYEEYFELPEVYEGANPSWFGYVIKVKPNTKFTARDLQLYLQGNNIMSRAYFAGNITKQPLFASGRYEFRQHPDLRVSDEVMNNAFWIGVHPAVTQGQREHLKEVVDKFMTFKP